MFPIPDDPLRFAALVLMGTALTCLVLSRDSLSALEWTADHLAWIAFTLYGERAFAVLFRYLLAT